MERVRKVGKCVGEICKVGAGFELVHTGSGGGPREKE